MLKILNRKIKQLLLIVKIFKTIVPPSLYKTVIKNSFKNFISLHTPSSAILGLTYNCQCDCIHCSAGSYEKQDQKELSTKQWLKLLSDIAALGVPRINFSGGEALLRKDIFEIIEYASTKFVVILESNGQLLDEETIKHLKQSRLSCLAVSIDSPDPQTHNKFRKLEKAFEKANQGIKLAVKHKLPCLLSTYFTAETMTEENLKKILHLSQKLNVLATRIMPVRPTGNFSCETGSLLTTFQEKELSQKIDPSLAYFKGLPAPEKCGLFCKATFYISPYGDVQLCPYLPLSFGNISQENLNTILEKMWKHPVFKNTSTDCLIINQKFREKNITPKLNQKNTHLPLKV